MTNFPRSKRWILAFSLTELMAVSAIVTSIPAAQYARAKQKAVQMQCVNNLQEIGKSIIMYQMSEGHYAKAIFFPKKPFSDPSSIATILQESGAALPREMWVCPAAPAVLKKRGITFIYNDKFGGRSMLPKPEKAWLMIEVNCVSTKVPPPHPQGYNILFADGHVITSKRLPKSIKAKQQAAVEEIRRELERGGKLARFFGSDEDGTEEKATNASAAPRFHEPPYAGSIPPPSSLRASSFQRIRNAGLRERTAPLHARRACAARQRPAPVARPGA